MILSCTILQCLNYILQQAKSIFRPPDIRQRYVKYPPNMGFVSRSWVVFREASEGCGPGDQRQSQFFPVIQVKKMVIHPIWTQGNWRILYLSIRLEKSTHLRWEFIKEKKEDLKICFFSRRRVFFLFSENISFINSHISSAHILHYYLFLHSHLQFT